MHQSEIGGNEFVVQISANLQYLKSYNYDLFSFYPTNREPSHWDKILQSIELQDLTDRQPILVYKCKETGKLFISDGQNRFIACKKSKRPIYAIVVMNEDLTKGEESLSILNSYQKNWSPEDYLNYFCDKGYEDYVNLRVARLDTGFSISTLTKFWQNGSNAGNPAKIRYQSGKLKYPKSAIIHAHLVKRVYSAVLKHKSRLVEVRNSTAVAMSIYAFLRAGANSNEFVNQLVKNGHMFEYCGSSTHYFRLWNHIYNFRKHETNKQLFVISNATSNKGRAILK